MEIKDVIKTCEVRKAISKKGAEYYYVFCETIGGSHCTLFFNGENRLFPELVAQEIRAQEMRNQMSSNFSQNI